MELTSNEKAVMEFLISLDKGVWASPTWIGQVVGGGRRHSAWASPICKRLVEKGLIERSGYGHYRVIKG